MSESDRVSLGESLKRRREELGLSLSQVAEKTRIRQTFLRAMEENRFDGFPGDTYLLGFLKLYADTLGLESASVIEQFREQAGVVASGRERKAPASEQPVLPLRRREKSPVSFRLLLGLTGVALGVACFLYVFWPFAPDPRLNGADSLSAVSGEFSSQQSRSAEVAAGEVAKESVPLPDNPAVTAAPVAVPSEPGAPTIPVEGAMLRIEALGKVQIEVQVDALTPKQYDLTKDTVLSWQVEKSLRLQMDTPDMVRVWLGDRLLDLQGRSQLMLPAQMEVAEEERR